MGYISAITLPFLGKPSFCFFFPPFFPLFLRPTLQTGRRLGDSRGDSLSDSHFVWPTYLTTGRAERGVGWEGDGGRVDGSKDNFNSQRRLHFKPPRLNI